MPADSARVGDPEREHVAAALAAHVGAGGLSLSEFDERVRAAYAATTVGDLRELLDDLPRVPPAVAARPRSPWHSWALTAVICLTIWAATSLAVGEMEAFWPGWVIGPWGAVLMLRHVLAREEACS